MFIITHSLLVFSGNTTVKTQKYCEHKPNLADLVLGRSESSFKILTQKLWHGTGAERVNDVDDEAVRTGSHAEGPGADEKRDCVEQIRQVTGDVQTVVEGQHEQVAGQDGNVVPQSVIL